MKLFRWIFNLESSVINGLHSLFQSRPSGHTITANAKDLEELLNKIMSKVSDVAGIATDANTKLTAALAKLEAVDTAVKALVAASNNPDANLDPATQSALDSLVATVNTVSGEADTLTTDSTPAAPTTQ